MDKRIRIGISFEFDPNWVAGAYYIVNLIKAMNLIDDNKKPEITVLYFNDESLNLIKEINYPYIKFMMVKYSKIRYLVSGVLYKFFGFISDQNLLRIPINIGSIDYLFPANSYKFFGFNFNCKRIYWIPDFQEHFLPDFFNKSEKTNRKKFQKLLVKKEADIVLSSHSALNDFYTIYPSAKNKLHVLRFAVFHNDDYQSLSFIELKKKYNIPNNFFFCANQFWSHKNHITIFKALALLKKKGIKITIIFSGAQVDYRNSRHFNSLIQFIEENEIQEYVKFIGFINRKEQLGLMSYSIAIVQPSLFEGWSTVVEDAKSLNKSIILSSLNVHQEQISQNATFFEPLNEVQLADILENFSAKDLVKTDYNINKKKFADDIMTIFK